MKIIYLSAALAATSGLSIHAEEQANQHTAIESLNPALSVVVDGLYQYDDSSEGISHIKEEMPGFGHGHEEEEHAHGIENGFNLREVELYVTGEIDGYLYAESTFAFSEEEAEVETAFFQTTALPWGFSIKGGKFFSDFGIVNTQHPHQWSFSDQPLIYELALGDHGLNEIGAQVGWVADAPFHFSIGAEAFQGDNEAMFAYEGDDPLPRHSGPRLGVGWLKAGPTLPHGSTLQFGVFGATGYHQEIHEEIVGTNNHLDGTSYFVGGDMQYTHLAHGDQGQGDFDLQAEYFLRNKDLNLEASDDPGAPLGERLDSSQDGYYVQARYGFLPRWRAGLRWEQVGLTNDFQEPGEASESFGDSWRATAMLDFSPSPSTVVRFQAGNGEYTTETGTENVWEGFVQVVFTLGTHRHSEEHACTH